MPSNNIFDRLSALFFKAERNKPKLTIKERFSALKNIPRFFKLIWETSPSLTIWNILLRVIKSLFAPAILYVGKLIIDQIVLALQTKNSNLEDLWLWIGVEL